MHIIDILLHQYKKIYFRYLHKKMQSYKSVISRHAPYVYISYISEIFYYKNDDKRLNQHQNKREALSMVTIFNQLGYNVFVQQSDSNLPLPNINVSLIFGIEPNFIQACKKWPNAIKIYYGTGSYYEFLNNQIINATDNFNNKYHCNLPYSRLVIPNESSKIADIILQIGSHFTIETYPEKQQNKIEIIHQSTLETQSPITNYSTSNEFLFMASNANILRGLPFLFDYFSKNQNITLNIVGTIEPDFYEIIKNKHTPNIKLYGFLELMDIKLHNIISRCNFFIYPSGSEGLPGSVLHAMKMGLIPIVTRWAATDELNSFGYIFDNWNSESISNGIKWALSLSPEKICKLKKQNVEYINNNYNLYNYCKEFNYFFSKIVKKTNHE